MNVGWLAGVWVDMAVCCMDAGWLDGKMDGKMFAA